MDYQNCYDQLISTRKSRINEQGIYYETHGNDERITLLHLKNGRICASQ